jgi:hypothetical protein
MSWSHVEHLMIKTFSHHIGVFAWKQVTSHVTCHTYALIWISITFCTFMTICQKCEYFIILNSYDSVIEWSGLNVLSKLYFLEWVLNYKINFKNLTLYKVSVFSPGKERVNYCWHWVFMQVIKINGWFPVITGYLLLARCKPHYTWGLLHYYYSISLMWQQWECKYVQVLVKILLLCILEGLENGGCSLQSI